MTPGRRRSTEHRLRALPLCIALLLATSCDGSEGCGGEEYNLPALDLDAGAVDGSPAGGEDAPLRARREKLVISEGPTLPLEQARRGRLLAKGSRLRVAASSHTPPRFFLERSDGPEGPLDRVDLLDLDGQVLARDLASLRAMSPVAGAASVRRSADGTDSLLRLEDGMLVTPEPRGPDGVALEGATLVLDEESPEILLFARDDDGGHRYGRWDDLASGAVVLDHESPVAPTRAAWDRRHHAFDIQQGWGTPGPRGTGDDRCVRARVHPLRGATCRSWGDPEATRPQDFEQAWLTGGWVTESSSGYTMALDLATGERQWLAAPQCPARLVAILPSPPRVLTGCVGGGTRRTYSIWRPGASVLFDLDLVEASGFLGLGTIGHPLLPDTAVDWHRDEATRWIDLEAGALLETPPLRPIAPGSQPRETFASQRREGRVELFHLDARAPSLRRIASYDDCDGELRLMAHRPPLVAVACSTRRGDQHLYDLVWTEILDLDAGRRWRTDAMVEAFTAGGVVASDRQVDGAESELTATEVFRLDLPGPGG